MKKCEMHKTKIFLPQSQFSTCTHCNREMCITCIVAHAKEVKHAFHDVPETMRRTQ